MVNLVTIEEYVYKNKGYLALFLREGKTKTIKIIDDFKFYFYSPSPSGTLPAIDGEKVIKHEFDSYNEVPKAKIEYEKTYEADVHATNRYLIDCVQQIDKVDLRIQYTDIEKDPQSDVITCISVFDNYLNRCIAFSWREDLTPSKQTKEYSFPSGYKFTANIHLYNSRKAMLQDYINFIQVTDPDILTGHFFVKYDAKEIINEIKSVGLDPADLSPIHRAYMIGDTVNKHEENIKIMGRVLFDMMKGYSSLQPSRLPSYSLEYISQKEFGEGKEKRKMSFTDTWKKDIDHLIEYCCKDSVLVYRIDVKKKIIPYFDTLRRFVGSDWSSLFSETLLWDQWILRRVHGKMALPTKRRIEIGNFAGGKVVQPPEKGIHSNVLLVDFKSLYPSIIISMNMSPETLVKGETPDPSKHYILPNGIAFRKEPIGILPQALIELIEIRKKVKKERDTFPYGSPEYETLDHQQFAMKVLCNALWGAMGYMNFRLATPEIAQSITLGSRSVLSFGVDLIEKHGYKIIAGDTDSLFIKSHYETLDEMKKEINSIVDLINSEIKNFIKGFSGSENCYVKIEAKKIYKNLMISEKKSGIGTAKKRYAGLTLWNEGETLDINGDEALDIVGFEQKRSDNSQLSRDLQKKVLRMLLEGKTNSDLKAYITGVITSISSHDVDYEYVGIPKGLSQSLEAYKTDNPHRRGAIYSNKYLGGKFGVADKPKIIYVRGTGKYPKTDVIAFNQNEDIPKDFNMDVEIMIDKSIKQKVEHILDAAGLNFDELLHKTSKLEEFF